MHRVSIYHIGTPTQPDPTRPANNNNNNSRYGKGASGGKGLGLAMALHLSILFGVWAKWLRTKRTHRKGDRVRGKGREVEWGA